MPNESSPLSYQTTMPEMPDVSYSAWRNNFGGPAQTRLGSSFWSWLHNTPNYNTWRTNQLDKYNAAVSAYNAYASSPEGNRQQLEDAGYNVNYSPGQVSQASPLSYQNVDPQDGLQEISSGIGGLLQMISAVQGFKSMAASIVGKQLDNTIKEKQAEGLAIDNKWKDRLYQLRSVGLGIENQFRPDLYGKRILGLGYQADRTKLMNEVEYGSRFGDFMPHDLFVGDHGEQYNLFGVRKGLMYQRGMTDVNALKASIRLRDAQAEFAKMNSKEKEFVIEQIKPEHHVNE